MFSGLQASINIKSNGLAADLGPLSEGDELTLLQSVSSSAQTSALQTVDQVLNRLTLLAETVKLRSDTVPHDATNTTSQVFNRRDGLHSGKDNETALTRPSSRVQSGRLQSKRALSPDQKALFTSVVSERMANLIDANLSASGLQHFPAKLPPTARTEAPKAPTSRSHAASVTSSRSLPRMSSVVSQTDALIDEETPVAVGDFDVAVNTPLPGSWAATTGLSHEVRTLQGRVDAIIGKGMDYSSIRQLYEDKDDVDAISHSKKLGSRPVTAYNPDMPVALAGYKDLVKLAPPEPKHLPLPTWLKNRPDFQTVESDAKKLGNAAVQGQGFGKGALVLVKRALETPGPSRGVKDIEVLSSWLRSIDQFASLGALQLAIISRSLTVEHLQPGSKMTPTTEGVYVVLSGHLHIMRADGHDEIVGPGQTLGARSWWAIMSHAIEQRHAHLGRRLSIIVSAAREEAKREARQQLGGLTRSLSSSKGGRGTPGGIPAAFDHPAAETAFEEVPTQITKSTADLLKSALGLGEEISDNNAMAADIASVVTSSMVDNVAGGNPDMQPRRRGRRRSSVAIENLKLLLRDSLLESNSAAVADANQAGEGVAGSADGSVPPTERRPSSRATSRDVRTGRGRRMSLFDASCIGRALASQDVGSAVVNAAASNLVETPNVSKPLSSAGSLTALAGVSSVVRLRLQGLAPSDIDKLALLTPDDVIDGVTLVRLGLGEYHDTLTRHRKMVTADTARYLNSLSDFRHWGSTRLSAVSRAFERRTYPPHHVIFRQGDIVDSICLIQSGTVHVYRQADEVNNDTFPTGAHSWRIQSEVKPVLVHVDRLDGGQWFGLEALDWYPVLAAVDAELRGPEFMPQNEADNKRRGAGAALQAAIRHMDVLDVVRTVGAAKRKRERRASNPVVPANAGARRPSIMQALELLGRAPESSAQNNTGEAPEPVMPAVAAQAPEPDTDATAEDNARKLPNLRLNLEGSDAADNNSMESPEKSASTGFEPPKREVSAICGSSCVVLHLRPEYFQLLVHKGLFPKLQAAVQTLRKRINDSALLDARAEKRQLEKAVRMLRNEAYGKRYTRSVNQGVVLVPETEPVKDQRESSMYIYEEGVLTSSVMNSIAWSKKLGRDLPYIEDQMADLPARAVSRVEQKYHLHKNEEQGDPAMHNHWYDRLLSSTKAEAHKARKFELFSTHEQAFGSSSIRLYDRPRSASLSSARRASPSPTPTPVKISAEDTEADADREISHVMSADSPSSPYASPTRISQSQQARATSTLAQTGVRITPLPTAGLRRIRVPLEMYRPLSQSATAQPVPLGLDPKHPRVLTKVPVLPDVHRPPSPEKILHGSSSKKAKSDVKTVTVDIDSMDHRMAVIYERAHVPTAADAHSMADRKRNAFSHLKALRLAREAQEAAVDGIIREAEPIDSEVLRYKSPIEKAYGHIINWKHQQASVTIEQIVRKQDVTVDGASALPTFWPEEIPKRGESGEQTVETKGLIRFENTDPIAPTMATAKSKQHQISGLRQRNATASALSGTRPASRASRASTVMR